MDPFIIAWVIEFLIRHRAPPPFLNAFLTDPRFPVRQINNPRLKKSICLRNIQDELSGGAVVSSEYILDLLEIIEEFDRKEVTPITHSMKLAYCAVAVQCTVRHLREGDEGKFFEAVKRIWRERVERLELLKNSELVSDELREVKEEMEAGLWNPNVSERLMGRVGEGEAVELVRGYVKEALDTMGPSFVDLAAEAEVQSNLKRKREAASQGIDLKRRRKDHGEVEMEEGNQSNADPERVVTDGPARQDGDRVETEEGCNAGTGPDIVVLDRSASPDVSVRHIDVDEVLKVREALKRSCMELRSLVKDPPPEALLDYESLRPEIREKSLNKETSYQNKNDTNQPTSPIKAKISEPTTEILNPIPSQVIQNTKSDAEIPRPDSQVVGPKCSLMERNNTARTFEWNESIDGTSQEAGNSMDKDNQPTESQRRNLPSFKVETAVGKKRTKRWWSVEEEDGLREGVKKFGVGNWKLILQSKRSLFVDRRPVDLKDKWRNMTKSSEGDKEHD